MRILTSSDLCPSLSPIFDMPTAGSEKSVSTALGSRELRSWDGPGKGQIAAAARRWSAWLLWGWVAPGFYCVRGGEGKRGGEGGGEGGRGRRGYISWRCYSEHTSNNIVDHLIEYQDVHQRRRQPTCFIPASG